MNSLKHIFTQLALLFSLFCTAQQTVGVFQHDSLAYEGYTLFTSNNNYTTYMIDNCGRIVNTWTHDTHTGLSTYLLENGQLLRTTRVLSNVFNGGGIGGRIELFDWDNVLLWQYNFASDIEHQHHDIAPMPNGNILLLAWDYYSPSEVAEVGRLPQFGNAPVWSEQIIEIEPIGTNDANIVWRWRLWDHLIQEYDSTKTNYGAIAEHPELIDINFAPAALGGINTGSDWIHANSINYNADLDQIILNSRNLHEFWIIDHSTTTTEAASHAGGNSGKGGDILYRWGNPIAYQRGTTFDQQLFAAHDAHWIPSGLPGEGAILVFNNGADRLGEDYSTVELIETPMLGDFYETPSITAYSPSYSNWFYPNVPDLNFFSKNISGAQRLPNGNTLICEGASGHLLEVDEAGNVHWEYINPVSITGPINQGSVILGNDLFRAYRYGLDYPAFIGKDLTPGATIELNPNSISCSLEDPTTSIFTQEWAETIQFPSHFNDNSLSVVNTLVKDLQISVYNSLGECLWTGSCVDSLCTMSVQHVPAGLYFLQISNRKNNESITRKIIIP